MSIDIPRVIPVHTPQGLTDDELLRVSRAPRTERIPSNLGHAAVDRRVVLERRHRQDRRPHGLDIRGGAGRREGESVDIDV